VPVDDDILLMKTTNCAGNAWALIKDVSIDLDRFPYLTYRLKPSELGVNHLVLRVIDKDSGDASLWKGGNCVDAPLYYAHNLRKCHGTGVKTFDIRIYAAGWRYGRKPLAEALDGRILEGKTLDGKILSATGACSGDMTIIETAAGEYSTIDFLRAEAE